MIKVKYYNPNIMKVNFDMEDIHNIKVDINDINHNLGLSFSTKPLSKEMLIERKED